MVVVLGLLAGVFFGAVNVAVRVGLRRFPDVVTAGFVTAAIALILVLAATLATTGIEEARLSEAWPFLLIGMFVPGFTQILWVVAIRDAGPARAAILMATSPLLSAVIALGLLSEPFRPTLAAGTVLVVAGAIALTWERTRPSDFKAIGALLALSVAVCHAFRDNLVRLVVSDNSVPPLVVASSLLLGAFVLLLVHRLAARRGRVRVAEIVSACRPFLPAGVLMALVYTTLVLALDRGRVTVVAPLNGTNALWTVLFAALVLGRSEAIGRRLVLAAALIVAGGALVAATR